MMNCLKGNLNDFMLNFSWLLFKMFDFELNFTFYFLDNEIDRNSEINDSYNKIRLKS